jgi:tryptophan synthase alpha chain
VIDLEAHLRDRRDAGRKLLVPYVTGGLGERWTEVVEAVVAAGADAVEIGIPFSDPVMDGPTIQEASFRALAGGATPSAIISALGDLEVGVPMVAMTYYNIVFRTGHRRFARLLADNGVGGAVVPDVPLEELPDWSRAADDAGVATVLLAAPVTPDDRLARICERSRGFVYAVSVMGVTGERQSISDSASVLAKRLKAATDKPVLVGFGVSTPQHAVELSSDADGVVTASVLMRAMLDGAPPEGIGALVAAMRTALDEA